MSVTKSDITRLKQWLYGNREYKSGVVIISDYGHLVYNRRYFVAFKDSLSKYPSPQKVAQAIEQMLPQLEKQLAQPAQEPVEKTPITVKSIAHHPENKIIQQLDDEIKMLYAKLGSQLKPRLHLTKGEKPRYDIQKEMVRLDNLLHELLEKREYVEQHGKLPEETKPEKIEHSLQPGTAEAAMRFINLQKYVNRYQGYINKGNRELIKIDEQKQRDNLLKQLEQWEMKLNNYKIELEEVRKIISQ